MRAAFRVLAGPLLDHGGERRVALAFSELTLNTRRSPLTVEGGGRGGIRAGDRAPDAPLTRPGGPAHLYDLLYRGGWTLLGFTGRGAGANATALSAALTRLARPDLATFTVAAVAATPRPDTARSVDDQSTADAVLWDLDGGIHRRYGLRTPTLVLVRPDGHLALPTSGREGGPATRLPHPVGPPTRANSSPPGPSPDCFWGSRPPRRPHPDRRGCLVHLRLVPPPRRNSTVSGPTFPPEPTCSG